MNIDDKINNLQEQIEAQNQAIAQEIEVSNRNIEARQTSQNGAMSEGQAKALLDTIKNPEDALGLHLAKSITEQVQDGAGKERLDKTAGKIIESGLKTFETEADTKENEANKTAEEVYFDSKKVQLTRAGINKATSQKIMTRAVLTDDIWSDINFYLFTWWVVGINNYFANMSQFHWFFKLVINLLFTLPIVCLIPVGFVVGLVACVVHFIVLGIKKIVLGIKNIVLKFQKKRVKENEPIIEINREEKEETTTIHRGKNKH